MVSFIPYALCFVCGLQFATPPEGLSKSLCCFFISISGWKRLLYADLSYVVGVPPRWPVQLDMGGKHVAFLLGGIILSSCPYTWLFRFARSSKPRHMIPCSNILVDNSSLSSCLRSRMRMARESVRTEHSPRRLLYTDTLRYTFWDLSLFLVWEEASGYCIALLKAFVASLSRLSLSCLSMLGFQQGLLTGTEERKKRRICFRTFPFS